MSQDINEEKIEEYNAEMNDIEKTLSRHENPAVEVVARALHDLWMKWTKQIICEENISAERKARWRENWIPYEELSPEMKALDRDLAETILMNIENIP